MKHLTSILLFTFCFLPFAWSQPTPVVKATQTEVNAGVNNSKFVTPLTMRNSSSSTNLLIAKTNGFGYGETTLENAAITGTNGMYLRGGNIFAKTNTQSGTTIDCQKPDATMVVTTGVTFTGLLNPQSGYNNMMIRHLVPNGSYTIAFPASWKNALGGSFITTNNVVTDILVTCIPGVMTNVTKIDYY